MGTVFVAVSADYTRVRYSIFANGVNQETELNAGIPLKNGHT